MTTVQRTEWSSFNRDFWKVVKTKFNVCSLKLWKSSSILLTKLVCETGLMTTLAHRSCCAAFCLQYTDVNHHLSFKYILVATWQMPYLAIVLLFISPTHSLWNSCRNGLHRPKKWAGLTRPSSHGTWTQKYATVVTNSFSTSASWLVSSDSFMTPAQEVYRSVYTVWSYYIP